MPSPVLGIDLGTTNSVVAYADEQRVRVLRDADGQLITPSTVSFDASGRMLVGHEARERRLVDAENTVFSVKRLIGRPFKSPEVRRAAARLPFVLEEGATGGVVVRVRGETYTLPEVSSFILRKVRAVAEAALGKGCTNAVITVPANFNELQRMATRDAGRIAGLNVLRILNEPTAAALAYGYRATHGQRIAVYDLGGGTFDISILELSGDVIEVVATAGDTNLGGDDLDGVVADRMVAEFKRDQAVDLSLDAQQYERVRMAAEWIKCQLSHQDHAEAIVKEVAWGGSRTPLDLRFKLSRSELHQLVEPLIARTFTSCEEALRLANIRPTQLDGVILVGGQTRTPAVRTMVAEFFGRTPQSSVDPELVVAQGAALQGYALSGVPAAESTNKASTLLGNPPAPREIVVDPADPFEDEPTRIGEPGKPLKRSDLPFDDLPTTIGFRVDPDEELTKVGEYVTAAEVEAALATAREVVDPPVRTSTLSGVGPRGAGSAKQPPAPPPARAHSPAAKSGGFAVRTAAAAPPISLPVRPPAATFARTSTPATLPVANAAVSASQPAAASSRVTTQSLPSAAILRAATPASAEVSPPPSENAVVMRPAGTAVASADASPANDAPARRTSPGSEQAPPARRTSPGSEQAPPARRTSPGSERAAVGEAPVAELDDDAPLDPIRTHSMARLLAAQGHAERALSIYDELIAKGGQDPELLEEAAVLRSDLAPTRGTELPAPAKPAAGRGWAPSDAPLSGLSTSEESVQIDPSLFVSESQLLRSQFPGPPSMAPLLLDVTPHTLSVETAGGFCESIIERNAPIPTEQTRVFSTSQDDQETVSVRVCQGESRRTDENQVLGQFQLLGLRRARRGEVSIAVTFIIDADGSLNVKAVDRTTGQGQAIRVDLVGAIGDRELATMQARQRRGSLRAPAR